MDTTILDTINKRIDDQGSLMITCTDGLKASMLQMQTFLQDMDKKQDERIAAVDTKYENEVKVIKSELSCCVNFKRRLITIGQVAGAAFIVITTIVGLAQKMVKP